MEVNKRRNNVSIFLSSQMMEGIAEEQLRGEVRQFLDELTVEDFVCVSEQIALILEDCEDVEQLEAIADEVYEKIIDSYTTPLYADLIVVLQKRSPDFCEFRRPLINRIQYEFDNLLSNEGLKVKLRESGEDDGVEVRKWKQKTRGNISIIGELCRRKLLSTAVVERVLKCLVSNFPLEHFVELVCELLMIVGYRLEKKFRMDGFYAHLAAVCEGEQLSARIKNKLQNVLMLQH